MLQLTTGVALSAGTGALVVLLLVLLLGTFDFSSASFRFLSSASINRFLHNSNVQFFMNIYVFHCNLTCKVWCIRHIWIIISQPHQLLNMTLQLVSVPISWTLTFCSLFLPLIFVDGQTVRPRSTQDIFTFNKNKKTNWSKIFDIFYLVYSLENEFMKQSHTCTSSTLVNKCLPCELICFC